MNDEQQPRRLRGPKLLRIRRLWLMEHPLCVRCKAKGIIRAATELDHIVALANGGKDFDEDDGENRQGLCHDCHVDKTNEDLGHRVRPRIGADGWPT